MNQNDSSRQQTHSHSSKDYNSRSEPEKKRKDMVRNSELSEYLDSTPAYELKEEFNRFEKQVARYKKDNWSRQQQINKEIIPELKKWKTDTHQIVTSIYKYSDNTRVQARAATEIYEQFLYLQGGEHFAHPEDKEIFNGILDQAAKLATFGFGQAKFQDNDAKKYATKALRLPASIHHKGKNQVEGRAENTFDQDFMAELHQDRFQQRLLYNSSYQQQHGRSYGRGSHEGLTRGCTRGYTDFNSRPFGGHFHHRKNGRGNCFASPTSNPSILTDNNQQQ